MAPTDVGLWSRHRQEKVATRSVAEIVREAEEGERDRRLAFQLLEPLSRSLLEQVESTGAGARTSAYLALGQFPLGPVREKLLARFHEGREAFESLMAYVRAGGGTDEPQRVVELATTKGAGRSNLLLALVAAPPATLGPLVSREAPRAGRLGRANLGLVLGKNAAVEAEGALVQLLECGESWVTVHALNAVEAHGRESLLGQARRLLDRAPHPFIAVQAVRAAGGITSRSAIELCVAAASHPEDPVKAQALESLVRLAAPRDVLEAAAKPHLASPALRVRVNALLALCSPDDDRAPRDVLTWLEGSDPLSRLEAVFCLGFFQGGNSLELLRRVAEEDAVETVRVQAVKSLSKYPAPAALSALLPLVQKTQDRVALAAIRVLGRYDGEQAGLIAAALVDRLGKSDEPLERSLLYRLLGLLGGKLDPDRCEPALTRGLVEKDPRVMLGALEGWKSYGSARQGSVLELLAALEKRAPTELSPRLQVVSFLQGDLDAATRMRSLITHGEPTVRDQAMNAVLELGLLVSEVLPLNRFPALSRALRASVTRAPAADLAMSACWNLRIPDLPGEAAREDGDFPHIQVSPAPAPPSRPIPPGASGQVAAARRSGRRPVAPESRGQEAARDLDKGIRKGSYLLGHRTVDHDIEAELLFEKWPAALRPLALRMFRFRFVLVPAAGMLVVFLILVTQSGGPARRKLPPAPPPVLLTLIHVQGAEPGLIAGEGLSAGKKLSLPGGAEAAMVTPWGDRFDLKGPVSMKIDGVADDAQVLQVRVEPTGEYSFDLRGGTGLIVKLGEQTIGGVGSHFILTQTGDGFTLTPQEGTARVRRGEGETQEIARGTVHVLE